MANFTSQEAGRFRDTGLFLFAWVLCLAAVQVAGSLLLGGLTDVALRYGASALSELLLGVPVIVFLCVKRIGLKAFFGRFDAGQVASGALLGVLAVPVAMAVGLVWIVLVRVTGGNTLPDTPPVPENAPQFLAALAALGLAAPLVEEPAMRGVVLSGQAGVSSPRRAILMTALLFALLHGRLVGLPSIFLAGVLLTALAWRTGSLWPSVAAHLAYNTATLTLQAALLKVAAASGVMDDPAFLLPPLETQLASTVMWCMLSLPFLAAGAAVLWAVWRHTPRATRPAPAAQGRPLSASWPWYAALLLLFAYIAIDIMRVYGIIEMGKAS